MAKGKPAKPRRDRCTGPMARIRRFTTAATPLGQSTRTATPTSSATAEPA